MYYQYNDKIKTYVVRKMRLAGHLMLNGFKLKQQKQDRNNTGLDVYLFDNSPELIDCINEYIDKYVKNKNNK